MGFVIAAVVILLLIVTVIFCGNNIPSQLKKEIEEHEKEHAKKKQCCEWNGNKPCPYELKIENLKHRFGSRRYLTEESLDCCNIRQSRIRMAKMIVDGHLPTKGNLIVENAKQALEDHKKLYPEEHEYLFGKV
jgi:hypothetical protein